jgi:hypothetical protein
MKSTTTKKQMKNSSWLCTKEELMQFDIKNPESVLSSKVDIFEYLEIEKC